MKIISKHQDYYDSALAYGADESIVYVRHSQDYYWERRNKYSNFHDCVALPYPESLNKYVELFNEFPVRTSGIWRKQSDDDWFILCELIGFCGKIYPVYVYCTYGEDDKRFYDLKSIKEYVENDRPKDSYYDSYSYMGKYTFTEKSLKQWEDALESLNESKDILDVFFEIDAPTFVITRDGGYGRDYDSVIINPILKQFELYKILDAYTTFGQISQFISGVLTQAGKETVEFTDKEKIQAHGFDKWSFRRESKRKNK